MKTNKIKVVLSLNKEVVAKLTDEDHTKAGCSVHGVLFSKIFGQANGRNCLAPPAKVTPLC